jgi:glucosamine-6-phosphate deaminase
VRVVKRTDTLEAFSNAAADVITGQLHENPQSALALPTGNTPLGPYAELVRRSNAGLLDFANAYIFNLDEYAGLPASDPHSYSAFLRQHLIDPLGLRSDRIRLLRGDAPDLAEECRFYDASIAAVGGIDLCVLGLGTNGHVAFNEPNCDWRLTTHVVRLSQATRATHARQAPTPWPIPDGGVTVGIRTILESRSVLLLIAGSRKELAMDAFYRGDADPNFPVTCLSTHPRLTVIELCAPEGSR